MSEEFVPAFLKQSIDEEWFKNGNFSRVGDWVIQAKDLVKYNVVQELVEDWKD